MGRCATRRAPDDSKRLRAPRTLLRRAETQQAPERVSAVPGPTYGVSDGTRTRDHLDHNQVLYQLSYTHHRDSDASRRLSTRLV